MNTMCGYLAANIRVAANLAVRDQRDADADAEEARWAALVSRASKIGCTLAKCSLDPTCDGSCGCGPGLRDRNQRLVSDGGEEDMAIIDGLIGQLESNGGVSW